MNPHGVEFQDEQAETLLACHMTNIPRKGDNVRLHNGAEYEVLGVWWVMTINESGRFSDDTDTVIVVLKELQE